MKIVSTGRCAPHACRRPRGSRMMILAGVTLFAVAGCSTASSSSSSGPGAEGSNGPTITLPALLPLTGAQAAVGQTTKTAVERLVAAINDQHLLKHGKLAVDFHDNQSTASVAVTEASKILRSSPYILNGTIANTEIPVNSLVKKDSDGPVIYNESPAIQPEPGSYIFVGTAETPQVSAVSLNYAKRQGWTRIALITSTDPSGQDGRKSVRTAIKTVPEMKLVSDQTFNVTDTSVGSQIAKVKAARPDAIVLWSTGAQIGTVFQAMRTSGLDKTPTFMSYGNVSFDVMKKLGDVLPKHLYSQGAAYMITGAQLPKAQKQRVDFLIKAMGVKPGQLDMYPSFIDDGILLYVDALNKLGPKASANQIRSYIESLRNWAGVDGIYNFSKADHRGITGTSYGTIEYNHKTHFFDPAPGAKLGPIDARN